MRADGAPPSASSPLPNPPRQGEGTGRRRRALTLIELLVTIVIMVTVLAGVIPMLSPNNDSRKIREASRQLNSLLAQAQAQAARDGRPAGIAFREFGASSPYSGMAIEAYFIAEPQPFAGFSENSRVSVQRAGTLYGPGGANLPGNEGTRFLAQYKDYPVCELTFALAGGAAALDAFPPQMLRMGDVVQVADGNMFLLCDDKDDAVEPNEVEQVAGVEYLASSAIVEAIWINNSGQALAQAPPRTTPYLRQYKIRRQAINTSDQPLQFPRAIGIDTQASGATRGGPSIPSDFDSGGADTVGIMFSPHGALEALYFNGVRMPSVEQIFLLLGRFENGNGNQRVEDYDFKNYPAADQEEVEARRRRINWLSPDSMWVSIAARSGRVATSENKTIDPSKSPFIDDPLDGTPEEQAREQRNRQKRAVRDFAESMLGTGGR